MKRGISISSLQSKEKGLVFQNYFLVKQTKRQGITQNYRKTLLVNIRK